MSIHAYHVFEVVSEEKSFAKSAALLNLTPSAVSHTIAKLENEFDIQLFDRSCKGVELTDNGARLLTHVKAIQRNYELLQQEVAQIHGLLRGKVRLGCFDSITLNWLPQIIKSFRKDYPDIEIQIYQGGYNEIKSWISTNTVDLAFVVNSIVKDKDIIPLHKDMLLVATPKDFKPINGDYITVPEIRDVNYILQRDGYNAETLDFFEKHNMNVTSSISVESDESTVALVEAGFGFSIISKMVFRNYAYDVNVYPLSPPEYRTIGLVTVNSGRIAPATRKMRQHILNYFEENNLLNL